MKRLLRQAKKSWLVNQNSNMVLKNEFIDSMLWGLFQTIEPKINERESTDNELVFKFNTGSLNLSQLESEYGQIEDINKIVQYL